jgi:hypothetical protein
VLGEETQAKAPHRWAGWRERSEVEALRAEVLVGD